MMTSYPRRCRRRASASRFCSLSSINKIFGIVPLSTAFALSQERSRDAVTCAACRQTAHFMEQFFRAVSAFLQDLFHGAMQTLAFFWCQLFRGYDDNWDGAPLRLAAQFGNERKAIHGWHHEVEQDESGSLLGHPFQGDAPVLGLDDGPPLFLEQAPEHPPRRAIILHNQDSANGRVSTVFLHNGGQAFPVNRLRHIIG